MAIQEAPMAGGVNHRKELMEVMLEQPVLSAFEHVFTTNTPILESLLLQIPTHTILRLYHTSRYLRSFFRCYPTAWKYLSFRLLYPSSPSSPTRVSLPDISGNMRQSQPYALDQLLMNVALPFSPCLKSLELDNTAVSGQILISTVLHSRRETLEHLSVRGCKNVSLKYHIIPYLTMFGLQYETGMGPGNGGVPVKRLALKSLYTYRCRHHRRRPYLSSSLLRKDSDSEPTHELVSLCHKLGVWTDTAWCSTPAGRCFRRRSYVLMRAPQGSSEVWVVFDRLWRSKNWIGRLHPDGRRLDRDVRLWEHNEDGWYGEALGTGEGTDGEGKMLPMHLRQSHTRFVENIRCDSCMEPIHERCEQCSVLMHCVGCRKTLCASCAYEWPCARPRAIPGSPDRYWWAPGAVVSPCLMKDTALETEESAAPFNANMPSNYPTLKFRWCCTEPIFSGGGGISTGAPSRDVDQVRAVPLPRGQGWEDLEYTSANEWTRSFPRYAYGDPRKPNYSLEAGHIAMVRWLLGPLHHRVSHCPRNLCYECYEFPHWKVHCKACSMPLCIEHDLRGLRLRICGYRDLALEKLAIQNPLMMSQDGFEPFVRSAAEAAVSPGLAPPHGSQRDINAAANSFTAGEPAANASWIPQDLAGGLYLSDLADRGRQSSSDANSNSSRPSSPSSAACESPAEITKWLGCQSFFCPPYRPIGDSRRRCIGVLRECTSCAVYVCQDCVKENPPCSCSYCAVNYLCPNCARRREHDGTCRRKEEENAQGEQKRIKEMEMEEQEQSLEHRLTNEMIEFAGEFFSYMEDRGNMAIDEEPPDEPSAGGIVVQNIGDAPLYYD